MKQIFIFLFSTLISFISYAQKNFEGIITYTMKAVPNKIEKAEIVIYFKNNLIKLVGEQKNIGDSVTDYSEEIFDFEKGLHYKVKRNTSTIYKDSISNKSLMDMIDVFTFNSDTTKSILNNRCYAYQLNTAKAKTKHRLPIAEAVIWYSDKLYFTFPEQYKNEDLFIFANSKNIGLETYMKMQLEGSIDTFNIYATNISEKKLPDSLFSLPTGYLETSRRQIMEEFKTVDNSLLSDTSITYVTVDTSYSYLVDSAARMVDSAIMILDSLAKAEIAKENSQKAPSQPKQKTTPQKSSGIRRKEQ